jgi:threonyl-tRNA synthetase
MVFTLDGGDSPGRFDQYMLRAWNASEGDAEGRLDALSRLWECFHDTRAWNLCISGSDENWNKAEQGIIDAAKKKGLPYVIETGEAAFYGPKLDFMVKDAIGRSWQLGTIQVDYNLPERFELEYVDSDGTRKRPVMIHRAPFGSLERFVAVLLEHTAGHLPLWLHPDQVKVLPVSEKYADYAKKVVNLLNNSEIRASIDDRNETLGKRIRETSLKRVPLLVIVGEKEMADETVSVRRGTEDQGSMSVPAFVEYVRKAVAEELAQ